MFMLNTFFFLKIRNSDIIDFERKHLSKKSSHKINNQITKLNGLKVCLKKDS